MQKLLTQINSFLIGLRTAYIQQGRTARILFPAVFVLVFCCLCSVLASLFPARANAPGITPSPFIFPTLSNQPTPTALFNFGSPFPTLSVPTPLPATPAAATATLPPTLTVSPTSTIISTDTALATSTAVPPTATSFVSIQIVAVNKPEEYVDLQNSGTGPASLSGWRLVSEVGNQSCTLDGVLQPNEILRVWARRGSPGFSCRFAFNIWNDNQADPAVLYDAQGKEVSKYP